MFMSLRYMLKFTTRKLPIYSTAPSLCRKYRFSNAPEDEYRHPLITRYASPQMRSIWSEQSKFSTWRKLWTALATAQMELGVTSVTQLMVDDMNANVNNIDFPYAREQERILRHDVMAHVHTFGYQVPSAAGIIHLGATSCYVQDNCDLILMNKSAQVIQSKLLKLVQQLRNVSMEYRSIPTLGYTHLQPAQLTTVGKRMGLWLQDFCFDFQHLNLHLNETHIPMRGAKGTTGTQASFLNIFDGNHGKIKQMEERIQELMMDNDVNNNYLWLAGQTYPRKIDYHMLCKLSNIAQSCHKMCTDIRLLASFKELDEPFEIKQIGSSAMAYKRNPMRSERACSLARYLMALPSRAAETHSIQWMERSLDDSAIRRMIIPEAFLCCDAILDICFNIVNGIHIWPQVIEKRVNEELPFMATENILMEAVKKGGNRQELHEIIRVYSMEAARNVKEKGMENDLIERIKNDSVFSGLLSFQELDKLLDAKEFIGRATEQVEEYVQHVVDPLLFTHQKLLNYATTQDLSV